MIYGGFVENSLEETISQSVLKGTGQPQTSSEHPTSSASETDPSPDVSCLEDVGFLQPQRGHIVGVASQRRGEKFPQ